VRTSTAKKLVLPGVLLSAVICASIAYSHCQIPCGIYNDQARLDLMAEHITTIEKAMNITTVLSKADKPNMNQMVRWIQNKEDHADELSHIITHYFMAQRIKPTAETDTKAYNQYVRKLVLLHQMLVYSMKAKQTTDQANVEKLRSLLTEFQTAYLVKPNHSGHKHGAHLR
jgi:nickel superoxide dismutase